eukprot:scaffold2714_cov123-Isochrysis_galbana.AAC.13
MSLPHRKCATFSPITAAPLACRCIARSAPDWGAAPGRSWSTRPVEGGQVPGPRVDLPRVVQQRICTSRRFGRTQAEGLRFGGVHTRLWILPLVVALSQPADRRRRVALRVRESSCARLRASCVAAALYKLCSGSYLALWQCSSAGSGRRPLVACWHCLCAPCAPAGSHSRHPHPIDFFKQAPAWRCDAPSDTSPVCSRRIAFQASASVTHCHCTVGLIPGPLPPSPCVALDLVLHCARRFLSRRATRRRTDAPTAWALRGPQPCKCDCERRACC